MKKLLISAIIVAGLALGGVSSFAANDTNVNDTKASGQTEMKGNTSGTMTQISGRISGRIADIKGDSLTVKDQTGETHIVIPAEPSELAKVKVGENVTIDLRDGRAVAIHEYMGKSKAMKGSVRSTLSGQITNIKGDSFWLKDDTGKVHRVIPAEPSELAKIKVGENVTIRIDNGRAVAINKMENKGSSESMKGGSQGQGSKY
jgi:uncharacterized protein YdeI (BOF family)